MITRGQVKGILLMLLGGGLLMVGVALRYYVRTRTVPTHIEADNLRYLDPSQFKAVGCEADGVTWQPRADGGCYIADRPARPPYSPQEAAARCLQYDRHGDLAPIPNCMWNVPAAQPAYGDCWFEGSAVACCKDGHAHRTANGKFDCDDDPYAMQGWWMDRENPNDDFCSLIGISIAEEQTHMCAYEDDTGAGSGNITGGTLTTPHAGPTYGQWLTPEQMRASPPAVLAVPPSENDNSEELEQDDNYNDLNQGRQI